jgi:hypothetical protein
MFMKSINKTPRKSDKFDGITIGDEYTGPDKVEYVCSWCNRSLVRLSDRNNQGESWFCRNCSITFDPDDEQIRYKQRISIPAQDIEPAITSVGTISDVSIRKQIELKGGALALSKRGTIRFTSYSDSSQK